MNVSKRAAVRHLAMRVALGLVLGWFGVQELHSPGDWAVFVPSSIADRYPGAVTGLVTAHGFLLLLASGSVLAGVLCTGGSLLAAGMLAEVVLDLWANGGVTDLVVRDAGLLGLAGALAIDPVRVWHLDEWLLARLRPAVRGTGKKRRQREEALRSQRGWHLRAGSGAALLASVGALAVLLRATGAGGAPVLNDAAVLSAQQQAATPTPTVPVATPAQAAVPTATAAAAQPVATPAPQATSSAQQVPFETWRYREYAFEVYPGTITAAARDALTGFDVLSEDQGDSVLLTFKALSPRYHDATVSVPKGDKAYFIETSMGDDHNDYDSELNDDGVVLVDAQGYLVQN